MWRMIETRFRHRLWIYAFTYLLAWGVAGIIAWTAVAVRPPERIATLAGCLALLIGFLTQTVLHSVEARESRMAFHFSLPLAKKRLIDAYVVEPMLPNLAIVFMTLVLAVVIRSSVGGHLEPRALLFLAALAAVMLTMGQVHIFVEEVQRQVRWRQVVAAIVILALICSGALVGFLLTSFTTASEGELPTAVELFGQGSVIFSFALMTLLFAGLNRNLLARRQSYVK